MRWTASCGRGSVSGARAWTSLQPNAFGYWTIEEERFNGLAGVRPEFVPSISLREYIFGEAFGAVAAIAFLRHFEDETVRGLHRVIVTSHRIYIGLGVSEFHASAGFE